MVSPTNTSIRTKFNNVPNFLKFLATLSFKKNPLTKAKTISKKIKHIFMMKAAPYGERIPSNVEICITQRKTPDAISVKKDVKPRKEKLLVSGKDGLNSVELINAMVLSGLEEKKIELPLNEVKYEQKLEEMISKSR